jgi:hypothetical protein
MKTGIIPTITGRIGLPGAGLLGDISEESAIILVGEETGSTPIIAGSA